MTGPRGQSPPEPAIYVIGGVTVDLIMGQVAPWPRPGTETFVAHSELRAGGPAGNTALALKALGVPHHLVSNIGNDMFGAWLLGAFGDAGLAWPKVPHASAISIAIEHPGGERSFFTSAGNLAAQTAEGFLELLPRQANPGDIALLTGAFLYPALLGSLDLVLDTAQKRGFVVAFDTGWPPDGWTEATRQHASGWLALADHILLNEIECLSLSGEADVEAAASWIAARTGPSAVTVVKRGADGASAWAGGKVFHAAAPVVTVVDTTGAGDAFNAGYLAACLRGARIELALRQGVAVASAAIASSPRSYGRPG
jgi:sugar/nucleoside kinase (ribokinase family)